MANVSRRTFLKGVAAVGVATASWKITSTLYEAQSKDKQHDEYFNIGAIGPSTGIHSLYGLSARYGAQVAIDEINAKGIRKYKLNWQDTTSLPSEAPKCYQNLKEWGAQIILGPLMSESAHAVAMRAQADDIFMLTPSASSLDVLGHHTIVKGSQSQRFGNVFMSCPDDDVYGIKSAEAIATYKPNAKIGIIYDDSNPYSIGVVRSFLARKKELGLLLYSVSTFAGKSQNYSKVIDDAISRGADTLFLPLYAEQAASIIKLCSIKNFHPVYFGADGLDGLSDVQGLDPALLNGMYFLSTFNPHSDDAKTQLFAEKYKQIVDGVFPDQTAAAAYDAVYILDELLKTTKMKPDDLASDIAENLRTMIVSEDFSYTGLTAKDAHWKSNGTCTIVPKPFTIKDGTEIML